MVTKALILLAILPAISGLLGRDLRGNGPRGSLSRTSSHHRHQITTIFASFNHPVGEKRTYSSEFDVPAFKLGRGSKKNGGPTRLQSWVTSGVTTISNNYSHRSNSNTTPSLRILTTLVAVTIAAYLTRGIVFASVLSLAVLVYAVTIYMPTSTTTPTTTSTTATRKRSFLRSFFSFQQRIDRLIQRVVKQFRALEKASTITASPVKPRSTSSIPVHKTTSSHSHDQDHTSQDHHNNNNQIHLSTSSQSNPYQHPFIQSNANSIQSINNPGLVNQSSPSSQPTLPRPSSSSWFSPNTHSNTHGNTNSNVFQRSIFRDHDHDSDHDSPQHAAMNKALEIQAALDASSARCVFCLYSPYQHLASCSSINYCMTHHWDLASIDFLRIDITILTLPYRL